MAHQLRWHRLLSIFHLLLPRHPPLPLHRLPLPVRRPLLIPRRLLCSHLKFHEQRSVASFLCFSLASFRVKFCRREGRQRRRRLKDTTTNTETEFNDWMERKETSFNINKINSKMKKRNKPQQRNPESFCSTGTTNLASIARPVRRLPKTEANRRKFSQGRHLSLAEGVPNNKEQEPQQEEVLRSATSLQLK